MRVATRLGIVFGLGSLVAVVSVGVAAWLVARDETMEAVARQLVETAARLIALSDAAAEAGVEVDVELPTPALLPVGLEGYAADGELLFGELGLLEAETVVEIGERPGATTDEVVHEGRDHRLLVLAADAVPRNQIGDVRLVVLYEDVTEQRQALDSLQRRIALIAGAAFVVLSAAGWWVGRRLARPLGELTDAAGELARLDGVPSRIELDRNDEVGRLAVSVNRVIAALEIAREQQRRLVADASHELRTPLPSLRMRIEFLASNDTMSAAGRTEMFDAAVADLEQLSALVAELVDLAADMRGGDERPVRSDLGPILVEVVERSSAATGRRIDLVVDDSRAVVRPGMIGRAVRNLVDNAAKYSPEDAPISVRLHDGTIEVADAGPGIPDHERPFVFDRFYRSPQARNRPGNGIGLAIVKQVAEAHGGRAWVGASATGGAAVGFEVPTVDP